MAVNRLGTKLGGAFGQVQRTEYEVKIRDGITHFDTSKDQVEKILDRVKDTIPSVSGLSKHEKLAQTLKQTVSKYGSSSTAAKTFSALGDALQAMGQEDRSLDKRCTEFCRAPLENFIQVNCSTFFREKGVLDTKTLDMDGAKNENQKKPSDAAATKEQETTAAFNQQKKILEALIDQMPVHYNVQAASLKAYATAKSEYHQAVVQHLQQALAAM